MMPNQKGYENSTCDGCDVERWRKDTGDWRAESVEVKDLEKSECATEYPSVFFAQAGSIRKCSDCCQRFSQLFNIPECFWTDWCKRSNGYFGCENTYGNEELESHNTWFRFLVKQTLQYPLANGKEYVWYKLNIFTMWLPGGKCTTISFETPGFLKSRIRDLLQQNNISKHDPYWVHAAFLGEVVALQDQAVWSVRNFVRSTENGRTSSSRPNPQYPLLHDAARHAIHVAETLDVSIITIESMLMQHKLFLEEATMKTSNYTNQTRRKMHFYQHMMKSFRSRAQANKERLLNEITLAFNTVAQYDSRIAVQIGQAAQYDSAAMKTIAFLTLAFLPATFISAIFSMSFFNFTPGTDGLPDKWTISEKFWLYWAVAVPISAATVALWLFWHRFFPPKIIGE